MAEESMTKQYCSVLLKMNYEQLLLSFVIVCLYNSDFFTNFCVRHNLQACLGNSQIGTEILDFVKFCVSGTSLSPVLGHHPIPSLLVLSSIMYVL